MRVFDIFASCCWWWRITHWKFSDLYVQQYNMSIFKGDVAAQEHPKELPKDIPERSDLPGLDQTCCYWFQFRMLLEAVPQVHHQRMLWMGKTRNKMVNFRKTLTRNLQNLAPQALTCCYWFTFRILLLKLCNRFSTKGTYWCGRRGIGCWTSGRTFPGNFRRIWAGRPWLHMLLLVSIQNVVGSCATGSPPKDAKVDSPDIMEATPRYVKAGNLCMIDCMCMGLLGYSFCIVCCKDGKLGEEVLMPAVPWTH